MAKEWIVSYNFDVYSDTKKSSEEFIERFKKFIRGYCPKTKDEDFEKSIIRHGRIRKQRH